MELNMPFHGIAPKSYYEHITPYAFSGAAHRMAEREDRISRGTTVVSSDEYNPTMLGDQVMVLVA